MSRECEECKEHILDSKCKKSLEVFPFRIRTVSALRDNGILDINELTNMSAERLLKIRGIGIFALRDIRKVLASRGMHLRGDYLADSQEEKKLIESIPVFIKEVQNSLEDMIRSIKFLVYKLDQIHINSSQSNERE